MEIINGLKLFALCAGLAVVPLLAQTSTAGGTVNPDGTVAKPSTPPIVFPTPTQPSPGATKVDNPWLAAGLPVKTTAAPDPNGLTGGMSSLTGGATSGLPWLDDDSGTADPIPVLCKCCGMPLHTEMVPTKVKVTIYGYMGVANNSRRTTFLRCGFTYSNPLCQYEWLGPGDFPSGAVYWTMGGNDNPESFYCDGMYYRIPLDDGKEQIVGGTYVDESEGPSIPADLIQFAEQNEVISQNYDMRTEWEGGDVYKMKFTTTSEIDGPPRAVIMCSSGHDQTLPCPGATVTPGTTGGGESGCVNGFKNVVTIDPATGQVSVKTVPC